MNLQNHLGLFAKYWQPGQVKTRLAVILGDQVACDIYYELLKHLLSQLTKTADQRTIVYSPPHRREAFFQVAGPSWRLTPQADGDLGQRMNSFFAEAFNAAIDSPNQLSDPKIAVIGADCPLLDQALIERAFELLDDQPVVIGPSTDGGYYLLALRTSLETPERIFEDIPWSTSEVLPRTLDFLDRNHIGFELLPPLSDIDDRDDLDQLLIDLKVRDELEAMRRLRQRLETLLENH